MFTADVYDIQYEISSSIRSSFSFYLYICFIKFQKSDRQNCSILNFSKFIKFDFYNNYNLNLFQQEYTKIGLNKLKKLYKNKFIETRKDNPKQNIIEQTIQSRQMNTKHQNPSKIFMNNEKSPQQKQQLKLHLNIKKSFSISKSKSSLQKSHSSFQFSTSRTSRYIKDNQILQLSNKLDNISKSVSLSITKNPLRLIEYEMQGQRVKHDPQMILAKLRKLQNRAQLHRVQAQINQAYSRQKQNKMSPLKSKQSTHSFSDNPNSPQSKQNSITQNKQRLKKSPYLKIYEQYKLQKQKQQFDLILKQQAQQNNQEHDLQDLTQNKNGIKYFNLLKKHPKLINYTLLKKKINQGTLEQENQIERKSSLKKQFKQKNSNSVFEQEIKRQKQKQLNSQTPNPQSIIQRQITKFYLKKYPGKLENSTKNNPRSLRLIQMQNKISYQIDEQKISDQDRKKMRQKFNDLANQLSRSDRRNSLKDILPNIMAKK